MQGCRKQLRADSIEIVYDPCETCHGTGELNSGRIDIVRKNALTGHVMQLVLSNYGFEVSAYMY